MLPKRREFHTFSWVRDQNRVPAPILLKKYLRLQIRHRHFLSRRCIIDLGAVTGSLGSLARCPWPPGLSAFWFELCIISDELWASVRLKSWVLRHGGAVLVRLGVNVASCGYFAAARERGRESEIPPPSPSAWAPLHLKSIPPPVRWTPLNLMSLFPPSTRPPLNLKCPPPFPLGHR